MKFYETFENKKNNKYFREWELPDNFPIPPKYTIIPPPLDMNFPRFNHMLQIWEESKEDILEVLKEEVKRLEIENEKKDEDIFNTQIALADVYELMMGGM